MNDAELSLRWDPVAGDGECVKGRSPRELYWWDCWVEIWRVRVWQYSLFCRMWSAPKDHANNTAKKKKKQHGKGGHGTWTPATSHCRKTTPLAPTSASVFAVAASPTVNAQKDTKQGSDSTINNPWGSVLIGAITA